MIVIKAITIGLFVFASESLANICVGRWNGDQVPNPTDCSSFYVCSYGEAKLFKCLDSLLYDPVKRVCNWAYLVNCGDTSGSQGHIPILPNPPYYPEHQEPQIGWEQQGVPEHQTQGPQYQTQPPQYQTQSSQYQSPQYETQPPQYSTNLPPYTAHPPPIVDNPNVPHYSEADEFFPGLIESHPNVFHCTNPEFYFAPHPRNCEKYFICENYRIHDHQCGAGIFWDYVYNQCDFPTKSFCYSGVSITDYVPSTIMDESTVRLQESTEIIEDSTVVIEDSTVIIEDSTVMIEDSTIMIEDYTIMIEDSTIMIEDSTVIFEDSTISPEKGNLIECPGTQVFIGDPSDCRQYYICIGGIPIVTSCPEKMAWDKNLSQCNDVAWSRCFP